MLWHKETSLPSQLIVIPGGFSYGITYDPELLLKSLIISEVISSKLRLFDPEYL